MKKVMVEMYQCSFCGKLFEDEGSCIHHEEAVCIKKNRWKIINDKWNGGHTLGEINDEYHIIKVLPDELRSATKETMMKCLHPIYQTSANGTITKFVSTHIVITSRDTAWERNWHLHYSDFKYMKFSQE